MGEDCGGEGSCKLVAVLTVDIGNKMEGKHLTYLPILLHFNRFMFRVVFFSVIVFARHLMIFYTFSLVFQHY